MNKPMKHAKRSKYSYHASQPFNAFGIRAYLKATARAIRGKR